LNFFKYSDFYSGLLLAYNGYGDNKDHANISAALISSIWESFDKKGGREDLQESIIVCEDGIVAATRVANMLLALKVSCALGLHVIDRKEAGYFSSSSDQQ
ncbi:hypothetical protein TELCIR_15029, partial [Teladorsagia circumcincta]